MSGDCTTLLGLRFLISSEQSAAGSRQAGRTWSRSVHLAFAFLFSFFFYGFYRIPAYRSLHLACNAIRKALLFFVKKKWENSHISLIRNGLIKAIIVMSRCQQSRRRASQPHYWANDNNNNERVSNNNASDYCLALVQLHRLDWIIPVLSPRKSTDLPFLSHGRYLHFFSFICSMQLQRHRIRMELHTFSPSSICLWFHDYPHRNSIQWLEFSLFFYFQLGSFFYLVQTTHDMAGFTIPLK